METFQVFDIHWPPASGPVFWVSVCLVLAGVIGEIGLRYLHVPRVAGYVATGLVAGSFGVGLVDDQLPAAAQVVLDLALAVLLFEAGSRISLRWLRSNPWLLGYCLLESLLTFVAVLSVLLWLGAPGYVSVSLAAITMATSPAVLMRVASEYGAAGQVTERMIVMSGVNTCLAVLLSRFVGGWLMHEAGGDPWSALALPFYQLAGSLVVAALLAGAVIVLARRVDLRNDHAKVLVIGLVLLALSFASIVQASTLLVPLLAGILLKNLGKRAGSWPGPSGTAGVLLVLMLFVTTGAAWSPELIAAGGGLALALIVARQLAKMIAAIALARPSGLSLRQGTALGLTGLPLSAPALVMYANLRAFAPAYADQIAPVLVSAVAFVELAGPIVVRAALHWVREGDVR